MRALHLDDVHEVVLLAAHCDDLAIGAGGTIRLLAGANPGLRVHALVATGGGTVREGEERAALAALCPGADLELTVLDLPDGLLPQHAEQLKRQVRELARRTGPDLVLAPQAGDAHQDHRLLARITPTEFRDHLTLGYEIAKWESDLPTTTLYVPLDDAQLEAKLAVLRAHYPSQTAHDWFDDEAFRGLARVRGVQCHARWAEAFCTTKLILS